MRNRLLAASGTVAAVALSLAAVSVAAEAFTEADQAPAATAKPWTAPRTPDGHPDLQGVWNAATITPLERPQGLGKVLSEEEALKLEGGEKTLIERRAQPSDPERKAPPVGGDGSTGAAGGVGGYNTFWIDRGSQVVTVNGERRSSLVVDPPDGRVPSLLPEARRRNAAARGTAVPPTSDAPENAQSAPGQYDDVELRPLGERCLLGFGSTSGPPTLPNYFYNNLKQIVQTRDHVIILNEMVHDARIIPLNRPHAPQHIRKWMGDSVGRWEGDTLVVDTTNFTNKTRFRGSSDNLRVIERFTRVDQDTILYQFTVEDPSTWAKPWTGEYTWGADEDLIYEYACHEHNYALGDILRGARLLEAEEAAKKKAPKER